MDVATDIVETNEEKHELRFDAILDLAQENGVVDAEQALYVQEEHDRTGKSIRDVLIDENKITVLLSDRGPGIPDISLAMQEGYSTAPDNIRALGFGAGMGLPNMKRYSDEMTIESEVGVGTVIKMEFNVSK